MGEKALAVAERTLTPDHPEIASYLRSLAIPVANLGELARARALRERGLAMAEKALGPDHPLVGVQLNDLANSFFREGDYLRARSLYERALKRVRASSRSGSLESDDQSSITSPS